jgi:putative sigma-54 modulation protein
MEALGMQVSVTFRNMEPRETLRHYAQEKISKLKKYLDTPIEANAVLIVEKHRHIADVNVIANRVTINAREETEDMCSAIDRVVEKLERQVLKYKEKIKKHKLNPMPAESNSRREGYPTGIFTGEGEPKFIKSKKLQAKPMSVGEAANQLELLQHDFFIFTNSSSRNLNIIYRLKDGSYGLIEPQAS